MIFVLFLLSAIVNFSCIIILIGSIILAKNSEEIGNKEYIKLFNMVYPFFIFSLMILIIFLISLFHRSYN